MHSSKSLARKLSLDADTCVPASKLEAALDYLGIVHATTEDLEKLNCLIDIKADGTVRYGDFEEAIKTVFHSQLSKQSFCRSISNFAAPEHICHKSQEISTKQENDLMKEIKKLKVTIAEKDKEKELLLKEMNVFREKIIKPSALQKSHSAGKSPNLVSQEGVSPENCGLNSETTKTETQQSKDDIEMVEKFGVAEELEEMRTRASLVDCEYRKMGERCKVQEDVIQFLLNFVRSVTEGKATPDVEAAVKIEALAIEAENALDFVRQSLDVKKLPFGWEEALLPDGSQYFINHSSRSTSWVDPRKESQRVDKKAMDEAISFLSDSKLVNSSEQLHEKQS